MTEPSELTLECDIRNDDIITVRFERLYSAGDLESAVIVEAYNSDENAATSIRLERGKALQFADFIISHYGVKQ